MISITPHQERALNIDKSISLTANAGSGKTFVLTQRFLQIIINTSTPLNKIAAITFTEKAAGELFKRISVELDKLHMSATNAELKHRIEFIRKQLVSAKISTIHSFCIDLLREFPVEASLDANFTTINEQKASELIDLSVESALRELLKDSNNNSDVKLLIRLLGSKPRLVTELSELINKRKKLLNLIDKYYSTSEKEISDLLFRIFEKNAKILFENEIPNCLDHIAKINEYVLQINSKNTLANEVKVDLRVISVDDELTRTLLLFKQLGNKLLTKNGNVRSQGYLPTKNRADVQDSIEKVEDFFTQLREVNINQDHKMVENQLSKYILALINVFGEVLSNYEHKKSELGVLDFEDILLITRRLLNNEGVRKSLSNKFSYLLVDEYQDTNEIQYEIFLPLLDDLKKGNLFIVGDEKQSIYRFRDAELQVFTKTKEDIFSINGANSLLSLPDSFRMAPAICLFVNFLFKNLFAQSNKFYNEVTTTDLVCARNDEFKGELGFLIANDKDNNEAELTVKKIIRLRKEFIHRLKEWNDIAILVRKRSSFAELQKAFIKYHIPFNVVGGTGFYQKQSISDIYNYFAFLLNEKNDAALIGILRSPFFLISDVEILELSKYEGGSYWEKLKFARSVNKYLWKKIFNKLDENKKLASRIGISLLLRKILRESNFISVISSRINAGQEISNLYKLISITNDFFTNEFSALYDFVTFLKDSIIGITDESQAKIDPGSIGVNIMTIHQAKGLEFPAVFLYKCNDTTLTNKVKSKSFSIDKEFGILTKVPVNDNFFGNYESAPLVGIYNIIEEKKELAELKRLLYVGLTRAKDFLFITLTNEDKLPKKNSFSGLLYEGLKYDLSKENYTIVGELKFLQQDQNRFFNVIKNMELNIPLTRTINISELEFENEKNESFQREIILSQIRDKSKGEVISATRFSTFMSCPMKYNLLYNYKIGDLIQQAKMIRQKVTSTNQEEYNRNELNSYLLDDGQNISEYSIFKGKLIHYILRKELSKELIPSFVEERLTNYFKNGINENLKDDIKNDLVGYYDSEEFKYIKSYPNHRNEFEVYLKERDYYLFGIIDKLIYDENKIIIVDYKTDNISKDELTLQAGKYIHQLKFYAYIVSRLSAKKNEIEGRIIFTKFPKNPYVFVYEKSSDEEIKMGINSMITSIRNNDYSLNLSACTDCVFAEDHSKCNKIAKQQTNLILQ